MTNKAFENYFQCMVYCSDCGQYRPTNQFSYRNINATYHVGRCNVCDWFRRKKIFQLDGWTYNDIFSLIEFVLTNESPQLNLLADIITAHTLHEIVQAYQLLHIGNKPANILCKCQNCGKEIIKTPAIYLNNHNCYCSDECYWNDKSNHVLKGNENSQYKRIMTTCTYCGKPISIIPWAYNKKNSYGESNNFCSQKCYWEFRKIHYIRDKASSKNINWTPQLKEKMREIAIKNSRKSSRFDSKIQLIVNDMLNELDIKYQREYTIKYYAVDNYLDDYNLILEVMGDYWHANPQKYNKGKRSLNSIQSRDIIKDKQKHSYIKNHLGIEILYLWESDILNDPDKCKLLIEKYTNCGGNISNYHSFNYITSNNSLTLSEHIIVPFQEMPLSQYKNLIS